MNKQLVGRLRDFALATSDESLEALLEDAARYISELEAQLDQARAITGEIAGMLRHD